MPTPTIGGVGLIKDISEYSLGRVFEDDLYYVVGETNEDATALALMAELSKVQVKNVNIKVNLEEEKA